SATRRSLEFSVRAHHLFAIIFAGFVWAFPAAASPSFPGVLREELALGVTPPCAVCHASPITADAGTNPADTLLARAMVAEGLAANDDASLRRAILRLGRADSDGDGARDFDEIAWGGDPNHADLPTTTPEPPPIYGCGCRLSGAHDSAARLPVLPCLLAVAWLSIKSRSDSVNRRANR
ncbi:MAG TPA: hypothetical protein VJT73_16410, partial [Polyangiaceae bacterium]|nr:hypothetical protein [Polyangiaceae bacterium]